MCVPQTAVRFQARPRQIRRCAPVILSLSGFTATLDAPKASAASLAGMAVFLDPGHNGVSEAVVIDQFGQLLVIGGFGEFVDPLAGQGVADPVAGFGGQGGRVR